MSKQLTVGELIKILEKYSPDLPVQSEGCDCYGIVIGVVEDENKYDGKYLLLTRGI